MSAAEQKPKSVLDHAREYTQRGYKVVPVPYQSKNPSRIGWGKLHLSEAELPQYFNGTASNIGILLGDPSGGLVDVDLDVPEAVEAAQYFLPATRTQHGHGTQSDGRNKQPSHHWFLAPGAKSKKYQFAERDSTTGKRKDKKTVLVELRSTGC
jgi:hypothetical protein